MNFKQSHVLENLLCFSFKQIGMPYILMKFELNLNKYWLWIDFFHHIKYCEFKRLGMLSHALLFLVFLSSAAPISIHFHCVELCTESRRIGNDRVSFLDCFSFKQTLILLKINKNIHKKCAVRFWNGWRNFPLTFIHRVSARYRFS